MNKRARPIYMLLTRDLPQTQRHTQTKSQGMEKIFHTNNREKKAGVAVLVSIKRDFKTKKVTRDKEGHYIMIKGSIQQEYITIINIYAPNTGTPTYVKEILTELKGEIECNAFIL